MVSETELIARYGETDQMGIVHHSNYPIWFEAGRTSFFIKLNIPYSKIEEAGFLLPLTSMRCSFKKPARYEDEIIIRTSIIHFSGVRLDFKYLVLLKVDQQLIAEGETAHAWTDLNLKPVNLKRKYPELYALLIKAFEKTS
jgi:acyl-CoA thioester hydrolase